MKILITGGTGLIGSYLSKALIASYKDINITIYTRNSSAANNSFADGVTFIDNFNNFDQHYNIIINLAGEPINKGRWTSRKKALILSSRINITKKLVEYIKATKQKPELFISGSAIGYYGSHDNEIFNENSCISDNGFTHQLCKTWEDMANIAKNYGVRVATLRTGIVLAKNGGILKEMLLPFKFGLGCKIGSGRAWMSWIHIKDLCNIILHIINNNKIEGPVNGTSPHPVQNEDFSIELAKCLHAPLFLTMPAFIVKIIFGEMGETLLLQGQKVLPLKIIESGYNFEFPNLDKALADII